MLRIQAKPILDLADLQEALQNAIQLEHSTIPPYLTAYFTLSGTSDAVKYARRIIKDIVIEEMLHMTLASNVLNAIGGAPQINLCGFIPKYPGPLPMGVAGGLEVHLKRYSHDLVRDVFMEIEEPEKPLEIPVKVAPLAAAAAGPRTIGEFYAAIRRQIVDQGEEIFSKGDPGRQVVTGLFAPGEEFAVSNVETALLAIETIVEQGEGTPKSPLDLQKDVAHYYRFQELEKGMKLVEDPASPLKVSFDPNQPIVINDATDVIQMVDDPQCVTIDQADQRATQLADECDAVYSRMLNALHEGFNGKPDKVADAIGTMFEFKNGAGELLQQQLTAGPHAGLFAGPRFKYVR
jgi:Ferritin-like